MRKLTLLLLAIFGFLSAPVNAEPGRALIVYFAYSENIGDTSGMSVDALSSASLNAKTSNINGNIQVMAEEIQRRTGSDVFHILVEEPYDPDYNVMVNRARRENNINARPMLKEDKIANLQQYNVIYLGMPVWFAALPQAVQTFLDANDLSGKTVVPFGIHLGSEFGRMIQQLRRRFPTAKLVEGFTVDASTANTEVQVQFSAYLDSLQLN